MLRRKTILGLMLAGCIGMASAQSDVTFSNVSKEDVTGNSAEKMPEKWTFSDCMDWAINHSTDVKKALISILQADQDVSSAKDAWLPTVGFSTNQSFTNYPVSTAGRTANSYGSSYGINASWTVWEGNVRKYRLNSSKILKEQQQLAGEDIVKNLTLNILSAYLNILYAQETVAIANQTLEVSTTQTARAKRLMESGRSSKVEYAQIESQMAQDQYNLTQAQGNLASAKANLKKILALGLDYDIEIADLSLSENDINALLPSKEQTYNYAAAWLPGIKSNELSKEVYANDVKIAQAGNLPNIALQGGIGTGYNSGGNSWGWQMGHGLNEQVGVSVSIPIFDGNSTKRAVAKARLNELEYDVNRQQLLDDLSQTIEGLYIDYDNAKAKYASGQKQLEATSLTADLVNRQFELGLVNPLELLTAHNNLLNAKLELLQSKFMAVLSNKTINYYASGTVTIND